MDIRRERITLLRSTVEEMAWANLLKKKKKITWGIQSIHHCVCRRMKLPGRSVHCEKVRETGDV